MFRIAHAGGGGGAAQDVLLLAALDSLIKFASSARGAAERQLYSLLAHVLTAQGSEESRRLAARSHQTHNRLAHQNPPPPQPPLPSTCTSLLRRRERLRVAQSRNTHHAEAGEHEEERGQGASGVAEYEYEYESGWQHASLALPQPLAPSSHSSSYAASPAAGVSAGVGEGRKGERTGERLLVCQPTFGLGNRINALMMCQARYRPPPTYVPLRLLVYEG